MTTQQTAISFSEIKELSSEVGDGTEVYIRMDGEFFKATAVEVSEDGPVEDAVIVIDVED